MSRAVVVATMEEETAGVSNDNDDNNEDGHDDANDEAKNAAVTAEGEDDEHRHHQSI